jgi:hypothetical protein
MIVLCALIMLRLPAQRFAFVSAGLVVEAVGLGLLVQGFRLQQIRRRE